MQGHWINRTLCGVSILALAGLAACERRQVTPAELVAQCQAEVAPIGTYVYEDEATLPTVTAVEDGSEAGAHAFNKCIRQKAAAAGLISDPSTGRGGFCHDGAATLVGGATYCIGTN